jgi:hypothetical protein
MLTEPVDPPVMVANVLDDVPMIRIPVSCEPLVATLEPVRLMLPAPVVLILELPVMLMPLA